MKKLLTTTAMVSALISGAAFAEVKVGGNVEWTYNSVSSDRATDKIGDKSGFGSEENINITYTGKVDNLTLKAGMGIEDASSDVGYTSLTTAGGTTILWGFDAGPNSQGTFVPLTGDSLADIALPAGINYAYEKAGSTTRAVHDANHISIAQSFENGSVYFNYAPSIDNTAADSAVVDAGGSAMEIGANLKFQGLSLVIGQETHKQDSDSDTTTNDITDRVVAVSYNFGQFAAGVQRRDIDLGTTSDSDETQDTLGITYAVSDKLTLGFEGYNVEKDGATSDEEGMGITVGYKLGNMAIQAGYAQIENINHSAGKDADVIQIRTVTAF
jgi:predicted porin